MRTDSNLALDQHRVSGKASLFERDSLIRGQNYLLVILLLLLLLLLFINKIICIIIIKIITIQLQYE